MYKMLRLGADLPLFTVFVVSYELKGMCGFSRMGTVRPAPEGAPTEADSWSAQSHPPIIELVRSIATLWVMERS